MEYCINVFDKKLDDLIKISINERYANGDGVLFLNFAHAEPSQGASAWKQHLTPC